MMLWPLPEDVGPTCGTHPLCESQGITPEVCKYCPKLQAFDSYYDVLIISSPNRISSLK